MGRYLSKYTVGGPGALDTPLEEHFGPIMKSGDSVPALRMERAEEWREYLAGGGAALVAITITFPINKTMFRQQVHNIPPGEAFRQLRMEGAIHLYRGLLSPLLMKISTQSIMFGSYSQYSRLIREHSNLSKTYARVLGAILAGMSEACMMPLERVQVLMQDSKFHTQFRNTPHALYSIRVFGVSEYYRGLSAILLRNCPGNVIFFSSRERIKASLPATWTTGTYASNISDFFGGAFLGALISTIFYPVNVTKTHLQLQVGGPFLRFRTVFGMLLHERGWRGMFRGVHINYTRSFLSWGIINVSYENLLHRLRQYS
eukprot:maker-scaffold15_size728074-snap-gene-6.24 protein:Tk08877 transcript:maker-scaffold15_size728074-snap-gene-6.24-mRNA-1 annotation:"hypothetical protein CAPTEDRAFT_128352"